MSGNQPTPPTPHAKHNADALAALTGHRFNDVSLASGALQHPSLGNEASRRRYERLEFLGDRILALSIAELLYTRFPDEPEGALSKRLVALVRREALAEVAEDADLYSYIHAAPSARSEQGRARESMLADACEAVIGALFLDGGLEPARAFVHRKWEPLLDKAINPPRDPKTALQEWYQGKGLERPRYTVVGQTGPAHAPVFTIEVSAPDGHRVQAEGSSKRAGEQAAATQLLTILESADG